MHSITMPESADASMFEESCVCITNPELHEELAELQRLAGKLWTENKQLGETADDRKEIYHCTSYYERTQKTAELEDLFKMLQTKEDDVIVRMLILQGSCKGSTCHDLSKRMSEFENHVQMLNTDNRNRLATQQEYYNYSTCLKLSRRLAENEKQTDTLETINDTLYVAVHDLQETEESLRHEAQHAEIRNCELQKKNEHQLKEISRLRAELNTFKSQSDDAKEAIKDEVKRRRELTRSTSLMEKSEVKKLINTHQDRKEHEEVLNRQKSILMAELARLESLRDKRFKEIETLKTSKRNLLCQLHEADLLILHKDELITKQSRGNDDCHKTIEEQHLLKEDLKKSARDLKDQLEEAQLELSRKQAEDCDHNLQEELITVIPQEEVQPYSLWLKVFLFIVIIVVGFLIFGFVLTSGLAYSCHLDCHFLQTTYLKPPPF